MVRRHCHYHSSSMHEQQLHATKIQTHESKLLWRNSARNISEYIIYAVAQLVYWYNKWFKTLISNGIDEILYVHSMCIANVTFTNILLNCRTMARIFLFWSGKNAIEFLEHKFSIHFYKAKNGILIVFQVYNRYKGAFHVWFDHGLFALRLQTISMRFTLFE